jgi:hypothetical protein
MRCNLIILFVVEVDLVGIGRVRVGDKLIGGLGHNIQTKPNTAMMCNLIILFIIEVDLVGIGRVRVGNEELISGLGHNIQTKLFPLLLDPRYQPSET